MGSAGSKPWKNATGSNDNDNQISLTDQLISDGRTLEDYESECSWPGLYYEKVSSLVRMLDPSLLVEVGVAHGYHASYLLRTHPKLTYVGVDPYLAGYDVSDPFAAEIGLLFATTQQEGMERLYHAVNAKLTRDFSNRSFLYRSNSKLVARTFAPASVDCVFVDGDHKGSAVLEDLNSWWDRIRPGGLLIGDDWDWPEVRRAVKKFADKKKRLIHLLGDANSSHQSFFLVK